MSHSVTITVEPKQASVTIGDQFDGQNNLEFAIALSGTGKVFLSLFVPVGDKGLIAEAADNIEVRTEGLTPPPNPQKYDSANPRKEKEWILGSIRGFDVAGSKKIKLSCRNVRCRAGEDKATLTIRLMNSERRIMQENPIQITKLRPTIGKPPEKPTDPPAVTRENAILYFTANPCFLSNSGAVNLSWGLAKTDYKVWLRIPRQPEEIPNPTPNPYPSEVLSEKADFILTLRDADKNQIATQKLSVDILTKGWHEVYPLGAESYPSVIFDSSGDERSGFHAICMRGSIPVLCKSKNGLTGWDPVGGVPDGMESSPGILLKDRLWLIAGSAADPDKKLKAIYYKDFDGNAAEEWLPADVGPEWKDFEERMGHACVIVSEEEFWVLGGIGKFGLALNDVWSFKIDKATKRLTAKKLCACQPGREPKKGDCGYWSARCMFAAVKRNDEVWICGGVDAPYQGQPLGDLWTAKIGDPIKWEARKIDSKDRAPTAEAIGTGGTVLNREELFLAIIDRKGTRQKELTSSFYELTSSYGSGQNSSDNWIPRNPIIDALPSWTDHPHSIGMINFDGRIYLRYLHRNLLQPGSKLKKPPLFVYLSQ